MSRGLTAAANGCTVPTLPTGYFFFVYQSPGAKKDWRWRFHGPQDRIIAVSGEGYADEALCVEAVNILSQNSDRPDIRYYGAGTQSGPRFANRSANPSANPS